jgi:hypothetical protein
LPTASISFITDPILKIRLAHLDEEYPGKGCLVCAAREAQAALHPVPGHGAKSNQRALCVAKPDDAFALQI